MGFKMTDEYHKIGSLRNGMMTEARKEIVDGKFVTLSDLEKKYKIQ